MSTAATRIGTEDFMRRSLEPRRRHDVPARFASRESSAELARVRRLPPTRAARPARSRGVFLGGSAYSRLGRRIVNALCIAIAAISIVATVQFAEPAFNAAVVTGNVGPALVASAMRAPAFLTPSRARDRASAP
jgi:hypothetical protein